MTVEQIAPYSVFAQAMQVLSLTPRDRWHWARPQIIDLYRQAYRDTWSHPPTRRVLANIPNLMVYDDHELRDDLGDKPEHLEHPSVSSVRVILECGRKATLEYQKQLLYDVDIGDEYIAPIAPVENHLIHKWGHYGVLMLDSRGAKTFNPQPGDMFPYLTSPQWKQVTSALLTDGWFSDCKILLCCCQIPLFFFPRWLTEKLAPKGDDFEGHWCYGANQKEQFMLLDLLHEWVTARPESRNVVLIGGDMHLGGYSYIYKNKRFFCHQILVGPIANTTPTPARMFGTRVLNGMCRNMGQGWTYKHYDWFNHCNMGFVETFPSEPVLRLGHVVGSAKRGVYKRVGRPPKMKQGWLTTCKVCCLSVIVIIVAIIVVIVLLITNGV
eukprot:TRINITY_DN34809_c0_g1_i1.p1 TRINITY_DN34809_c0_g1~~TRINITY_DN34809_c0_g1_i1.p1  ORF type:complete len:403 (-),score=13.09 TRINITY_DN34809_c0_g1_i1:30-1175(-)